MILDEIIASKRQEIALLKQVNSSAAYEQKIKDLPVPPDFLEAIRRPVSLIAEVKKASPSAGVLKDDFDAAGIAAVYEKAGASAVSVLTDQKYFMGSIYDLKNVAATVKIPVLRKDFIIDASQIFEARASGAAAVLLIVSVLTDGELKEFLSLAESLGMRSLVEVHTQEEMARALKMKAGIIGINNRDLKTFKTDLNTTLELIRSVPSGLKPVMVSESGIKTGKDVSMLKKAGVSAILVGEELMRAVDPSSKIKELIG